MPVLTSRQPEVNPVVAQGVADLFRLSEELEFVAYRDPTRLDPLLCKAIVEELTVIQQQLLKAV